MLKAHRGGNAQGRESSSRPCIGPADHDPLFRFQWYNIQADLPYVFLTCDASGVKGMGRREGWQPLDSLILGASGFVSPPLPASGQRPIERPLLSNF